MNKKLKLFLGAYVNFANAQNINCDHIARYIDKDKFEVHTMYTTMCPIDKTEYKKLGIHLHKLIHHRYIWYWCKYLTMLFGKYDIYYLPKQEPMDKRFASKHKDKIFVGSVEGVVGEQIPDSDIEAEKYFNELMTSYFSISNCIENSVKRFWKKDTEVLYLGIDESEGKVRKHESVKNIVWIGSIIDRKRPELYLECAKAFPELQFVMIGDGDKQAAVKKQIKENNLNNISLLGRIPNEEVYKEINKADLLLMTSDKEGLPKVIGEAMVCGVPAIYINECYDVDYVESGLNGFAVKDLDEMKSKLQWLIDNPAEYAKMSQKAQESVQEYLWPELIKKYEEYFENVYKQYHKG